MNHLINFLKNLVIGTTSIFLIMTLLIGVGSVPIALSSSKAPWTVAYAAASGLWVLAAIGSIWLVGYFINGISKLSSEKE